MSEYLVKGRIEQLETHDGLVRLRVAGRAFAFMDPRAQVRLAVGQHVRVMARTASEQGSDDVVLIHPSGEPPRYRGPAVPLPLTVLSVGLLFAVALARASALYLIPALLLGGLQQLFAQRRLRSLEKYCELNGSDASATALARPWPQADEDVTVTMHLGKGVRHTTLPSELLELTNDAIFIWELDGAGVVYWNAAAERLYGYTREQALGRITHELLDTRLSGGVTELESSLARFGLWVGELDHRRKSGERVHVQSRLSIISREHRPWLVLEVNRPVSSPDEAALAALHDRLEGLRKRTPRA